MTGTGHKPRKPVALKVDDDAVRIAEQEPVEPAIAEPDETVPAVPSAPDAGALRRGITWGGILLTALGGLVALAAGFWLNDLVASLLARKDWLGWLTLGLMGLAGLAALMIAVREVWALLRLRRLGTLRHTAESAVNHDDKASAERAVSALKGLYAGRRDLAWGRSRFAEHEGDILDARELLVLAEREFMGPLDRQAHAAIAAAARRVSVLTAVSPSSIVDMVLVAIQNLRMLRAIATAFGARPGTLGLFKLARMVLTHVVLTGGIALGDDVIQQLIGQRLTAKVSARLGEGVLNGALTARIGLAAIEVCRPLPYIEAARPRIRDLVALLLK